MDGRPARGRGAGAQREERVVLVERQWLAAVVELGTTLGTSRALHARGGVEDDLAGGRVKPARDVGRLATAVTGLR